MTIPEKLRHFHHPTLVVIGDFNETILYRALDENFDEVDRIKAPEPPIIPPEGSVSPGGGRFSNPAADIDRGPDRSKYAKQIMEQVEPILAGDIKYINLVMPAELCRRFKENLPQSQQGMITKVIEADLSHEPLLEIIERLSNINRG
ncbi:MAG: hypothetical protein PHC70_00125 [Patescibacteria group bacterium]|jgi:hypothetical protein|nr:hypothetical protein [Patescibacteria group bacterium]